LKHAIVVGEGFSKLIVLSSFPSFSLFDMLFATSGGFQTFYFLKPLCDPLCVFALMA
jgi:hypothetical protein